MNAIRRVIGQSLKSRYREAHWSVLTALGIQFAIMVSGILVARLLGPENRGHLALIALAPLILSQVGHLGLPLALTYYTAKSPKTQAFLLRRAASVLLPALLFSLGVHILIVLAFASGNGEDVFTAALFTVLATAGWSAQMLGLALLQGRQRFGLFNILRSLQVVLYAALCIALLVLDIRDLSVVAAGWSFTLVISGITAVSLAVRSAGPVESTASDVPTSGAILRFGLKSLPGQVSPVESFRLDQLVVGLIAGPAVLGNYVAAYALTNLSRIVGHSIGVVTYPKVAAATTDQVRIAVRYVLATCLVCGAIIAGLEALAPTLIPLFFGAEFEAAVGIAQVLLIAAFFMSLKRILNDCARGLGRPDLGLRAEVISWIPLIPGFLLAGTGEGIAWTLVASSALGALALGFQLGRSIARPKPIAVFNAFHAT